MNLRLLAEHFLELLYPNVCASCKKRLTDKAAIEGVVCLECWQKIKKNSPPFCYLCGRHIEKNSLGKNICYSCARKNLYFDRVFAVGPYEGVIKELIHAFKYKGKKKLGQALARLMQDFILEYKIPIWFIDSIVPVPLHPRRLREREFNQSLILGRILAQRFNKPIAENLLIRHRHTKSQATLEDSQRLKNVKGSFGIKNKEAFEAKNILLVDDVFTSGATCSEAARTLKEAGATVVFVLTLAN